MYLDKLIHSLILQAQLAIRIPHTESKLSSTIRVSHIPWRLSSQSQRYFHNLSLSHNGLSCLRHPTRWLLPLYIHLNTGVRQLANTTITILDSQEGDVEFTRSTRGG